MAPVYPELQRLAHQLRERVPFRTPAGKPLVVYGYLRHPVPDLDYATACGDLLRWWADTRGWELGAVFRDLGTCSHQLVRPGFTGLVDVLRLDSSALALVVNRRQLSRQPEGVKAMTAAIRRTGSGLKVLTDELGRAR